MDTGICITCGAEDVDLDSTEQCVDCEEAILSGLSGDDDSTDDMFISLEDAEESEADDSDDDDM